MMKKIFILGLILIAALGTVSVISADDAIPSNTTKIVENGTLTLEGIQFKIPDGFSEVESESDSTDADGDKEHVGGTTVDTEVSCEFKNSKGAEIEYIVGSRNGSKIDTLDVPNAEKRTIGDKEGYFIKDSDDDNVEYEFEYIEDGKIVKIVASSEDLINQVLV